MPSHHFNAIQLLAYYKWEAAGRPIGDGFDCWVAAEEEFYSFIVPAYGDGPYPFLEER